MLQSPIFKYGVPLSPFPFFILLFVLTIRPQGVTQLLSEPFLQLPTDTSVRVVWFTEFAGSHHSVAYGSSLSQTAPATTTKLSRTREDTDPVQIIDSNADGSIEAIRYEYPKQTDYLIRDVVPLLETAGVQLMFYGHSHIWNRFISPSGMHFLEASNVGNTYKAFVGEEEQNCNNQSVLKRNVPADYNEEYVNTCL